MITSKFPSLPKVPDELPDEQSILDYLISLRRRMMDELTIIRKTLERADANSQTVAEVYEPDEIVQYSLPKRRIESTGYKVTDFAPADHDILSATHGDTLVAAVAQGSLIYGNATPAWAALAGDNTGTRKYLSCLSNAVSWEGLTITHEMLSATHTDSTTGTVVRGDLITGQGATPKWTRLAKGAANTILAMGASEPAWTTRATLFGSGTNNYIPKFIVGATPTFGNSIMSQVGTDQINIPGSTTNSTLRIGAMELQSYGLNNNWFGDNVYYNAGFKYRADGYASLIRFYNGQILLRAFASGSAGGAASEIDAFKTYSTGPCEATIALYTPQLLVDHITEKTGSHGIVLDSETYIGGTTNGVKIEVGGNLTLLGTATQWEDLRIEPVARTTGANAPTFEKWYDDAAGTSRGVYLYSFDDATAGSEKEVFFSMQMPHAWAATAISMHVHWVGAVDDTTADPRWGLEYTWKDIGEVYGDTTIVYSDGTHMTTAGADANVTAHKHYLTEFADITPGTAADGLSSIFIGRLFRDSANAADTYNATGAKCGLLFVDAHVEINSFGSKEEYTK